MYLFKLNSMQNFYFCLSFFFFFLLILFCVCLVGFGGSEFKFCILQYVHTSLIEEPSYSTFVDISSSFHITNCFKRSFLATSFSFLFENMHIGGDDSSSNEECLSLQFTRIHSSLRFIWSIEKRKWAWQNAILFYHSTLGRYYQRKKKIEKKWKKSKTIRFKFNHYADQWSEVFAMIMGFILKLIQTSFLLLLHFCALIDHHWFDADDDDRRSLSNNGR